MALVRLKVLRGRCARVESGFLVNQQALGEGAVVGGAVGTGLRVTVACAAHKQSGCGGCLIG